MPFNSDDALDQGALGALVARASTKGLTQTDWMTEKALQDSRAENKLRNTKFALGLEDHGVSLHWHTQVQCWWNRYATTLKESYGAETTRGNTDNPPTREGITLVLSTWAKHLRSSDRNEKTGEPEQIMISTLQGGLLALLSRFTVKYPDWKLSDVDKRAIRNMFGDLARQGLVRTERSQRIRSSLPVTSAAIILRRFIVNSLEQGVWSPDAFVSANLLFTVLCTTGARGGDLTTPDGEKSVRKDQHVQIRDLKLYVSGTSMQPIWTDLRGQIVVKWFKTNNLQTRPPQVHELTALNGTALLDPLVWIIVCFHRRGLLSGTVESILRAAARRPDRRIVPDPVGAEQPLFLGTGTRGMLQGPAISGPADSRHARQTMNHIGKMSGALQNLGSHSLRRGVAEDLLHLGSEFTMGTTTSASKVLGHSDRSERKGLTDHYASAATTNLLNQRVAKFLPVIPGTGAAPPLTDLLGLPGGERLTTPITSLPLTHEDRRQQKRLRIEVQAQIRVQDPSLTKNQLYTRARQKTARTVREAALRGTSIAELGPPLPGSAPGASQTGTLLDPYTISEDLPDLTSDHDTSDDESMIDPGLESFQTAINMGTGHALRDAVFNQPEDMNALYEDMMSSRAAVTPTPALCRAVASEETADHGPGDVLSMTAQQLVDHFSTYNVIRRPRDSPGSRSNVSLDRYRFLGRDEPTYQVYYCPEACGFGHEMSNFVHPPSHYGCAGKAKKSTRIPEVDQIPAVVTDARIKRDQLSAELTKAGFKQDQVPANLFTARAKTDHLVYAGSNDQLNIPGTGILLDLSPYQEYNNKIVPGQSLPTAAATAFSPSAVATQHYNRASRPLSGTKPLKRSYMTGAAEETLSHRTIQDEDKPSIDRGGSRQHTTQKPDEPSNVGRSEGTAKPSDAPARYIGGTKMPPSYGKLVLCPVPGCNATQVNAAGLARHPMRNKHAWDPDRAVKVSKEAWAASTLYKD
nr:hypothetical protein B0A51_13227 [Rachicladosporium sp. CCFEE 5018]